MKRFIFFALLSGCFLPSEDTIVNTCPGPNRDLLIDETFSEDRISMIRTAANTWSSLMNRRVDTPVLIWNVVVGPVEDERTQCAVTVVNKEYQIPHGDLEYVYADSTTPDHNLNGWGTASARIRAPQFMMSEGALPLTDFMHQMVLVHEFGHALGLYHLHFRSHYSIMERIIQPYQTLEKEELDAICVVWNCD